VRRKEILDAAVEVAQDLGYLKVTHSKIAATVCVSPSLVRKYFESKSKIRNAVMGEAVRLEILDIVLQGIAAKDPIAHEAPATLRAAALESCA
jgi:AcrR family transcriptional regulator